jgi:hypothetical protein
VREQSQTSGAIVGRSDREARAVRLLTSSARGAWATCALAVIAFLVLVLPAASASAAQVHEVEAPPIGEAGSGNGQLSLGEHSQIAVNQTSGDIYVSDTGNGRVEEFGPGGGFVRTFGTLGAPTYLAIDNSGGPSNGDVYVVDSSDETISKFTETGTPVAAWGTAGQLTGFSELKGITVGIDGDLYAISQETTVNRYEQGGSPVGAPFEGTFFGTAPDGLVIDPEGQLTKIRGSGSVVRFSTTGEILSEPDTRAENVALAVEQGTGDLYTLHGGYVRRYTQDCVGTEASHGCAPTETFGYRTVSGARGIAVGPSSIVYIANPVTSTIDRFPLQTVELPVATVTAPTNPGSTSVLLTGTVTPNGPGTECQFEVVSDENFAKDGFAGESVARAPCATEPNEGTTAVPVEATIEGLLPGTEYHVRLSYTNAAGRGTSAEPNPTFSTPPVAPVVVREGARGVIGTDASLTATIIPGGAATSYHFEYLTEAAFLAEGFGGAQSDVTPQAGPLPADNAEHLASSGVTGLVPGTAYVFRVIATSSVESVAGPQAAFIAQDGQAPPEEGCPNQTFRAWAGSSLPDCRAYEQVSPVDKGGVGVEGWHDFFIASLDGSRAGFFSGSASGFPAAGGAHQEYLALQSTRGTDGWSTQRLSAPESLGQSSGYLGSSENMKWALLYAAVQGSGPGTGEGLYLEDTADQTLTQLVAPEEVQAEAPGFPVSDYFADSIGGDGSYVFFETEATLTSDATPGRINLYRWDRSDGVTLAGVLPGPAGEAPPGGSFGGSYSWFLGRNTEIGGASAALYVEAINAATEDGGQIYFTAGESGQLYLRKGLDGPAPTTVHVSAPEPGLPAAPERPAAFQEATPDGRYAFFVSPQQLTADATVGEFSEGDDLYRFDATTEELVDVTPDSNPADESGAQVQGVLGVSADGRSGYFAALGDLAAGGTTGTTNLYRFEERGAGFAISFVAELSEGFQDRQNWSQTTYGGKAETSRARTSRVTPDGDTLLFSSTKSITGFDNHGCGGNRIELCSELFMYSVGSPQARCISCNPTGERPSSEALLSSSFFGAHFPPRSIVEPRITRNLSTDGDRVFFETADPLVPADTNGDPACTYYYESQAIKNTENPDCEDVYEWEAPDTPGGSCHAPEANGGCLSLLSTGKSPDPSVFVDASADGNDVFIATASQLVPVDKDELNDIYDVRVDGGLASQQVLPPEPCSSGEACGGSRAGGSPASTPGSSSFQGPGNPASCRKGFVRRHGKCVKKHKSRKAKKSHHKNDQKKKHHRKQGHHDRAKKNGGSK